MCCVRARCTSRSWLMLVRWSTHFLQNRPGLASVSTMAKTDAHTSRNRSRPLLKLLRRPPHSLLCNLLPCRPTLPRILHSRTRMAVHSPRMQHFLQTWVWLPEQECKDSIEQCTWGTSTQRRRRRTSATRSGEVCYKVCGTCKTSILR